MWNAAAGLADCGRLARQTCRRGLFTLILALLAGLSMMALSGDAAAQKVAGGGGTRAEGQGSRACRRATCPISGRTTT